ncbi:MAG TPA: chromosome segregation protein SMC, partial [Burkholderiaceae bacterium]|nr:chromosome segregation protein SMC [Burkholderiaceae bacterium]
KAQTQLEEAQKSLNELQVRTPAWSEARARLDAAQGSVDAAQASSAALETQRAKLERVRRLSPQLLALRARQTELEGLGAVVELPADAEQMLGEGQSALADATVALRIRTDEVAARVAAAQAVHGDPAALALAGELKALGDARARCAGHAERLVADERELALLLADMRAACAQLGWPRDEAAVRARLPGALALRGVKALVGERGAVFESLRGALRDVASRSRELDALGAELRSIEVRAAPAGLAEAVNEARALRATAAKERQLADAVDDASRVLRDVQASLAPWSLSAEALRALALPAPERVAGLQSQRQALERELRHAREQREQAQARLEAATLALRQFTRERQVVTLEDVREARAQRDATWLGIKQQVTPLALAAPALDAAITLADERADARVGGAAEAAQLQTLKAQVESATLEAARLAQIEQARSEAVSAFDAAWASQASSIGLPGMVLDELPGWQARRERALQAASDLALREREQAADRAQRARVASVLALAMREPSQQGGDLAGASSDEQASGQALLASAEALLRSADAALASRDALQKQLRKAELDLASAQQREHEASQACSQWEAGWTSALAAAGLAGAMGHLQETPAASLASASSASSARIASVAQAGLWASGDARPARAAGAAQTALELAASAAQVAKAEAGVVLVDLIATRLGDGERLRRESIDVRRRELDALASETRRLALALNVEPPAPGGEAAVARALLERLAHAERAHQASQAAQADLAASRKAHADAALRHETAQARLAPLLALAGVESVAQAIPLAARSSRRRQLLAEASARRDALLADGEGLSQGAIEAEIDAHDVTAVPGLLEQVKAQQRELNESLAGHAAERAQAQQALAAISGHGHAATAEARRQEALAAMADAAERYLHVATAAKLLRWAIDRYRDRKQGPMLARASAVFSTLTLGGFDKLLVDDESAPPKLSARRSGTGAVVGVDGLSEGTRDQLFLALRLAALELHLAQGRALPFVADDLFVNFDDARSRAGLQALKELSTRTQVIFLTHHAHLVPVAREVFGEAMNVVAL